MLLTTVCSHRRLLNYIALGFLLRHEPAKNVFALARNVSTTCVLYAKVRRKPKKEEISEKKLVGTVISVLVLNTVTDFQNHVYISLTK